MKHIKLKLPKINKIIFLVFLIILGSYLIIMILKNKENFRRRRLPPNSYKCAKEGSNCKCDGKVFFGRGRKWSKPKKVWHPSGKIKCKNSIFGDPFPGKKKVCRCVPAKQDAELKVGDSVKCTDGLPSGAPAGTQHKSTRVYRYMGEKELASYPSRAIASSWNPNWNLDIKNIKCKDYKWAKPMKLKINPRDSVKDLDIQPVNQEDWKELDGLSYNNIDRRCINKYTPQGISSQNFKSALGFNNKDLNRDQTKQGIQYCKDICHKDCDCKAVNIHTIKGDCHFIKAQYNHNSNVDLCMKKNCYPKPKKEIENHWNVKDAKNMRREELLKWVKSHLCDGWRKGLLKDTDLCQKFESSQFNLKLKQNRITGDEFMDFQQDTLKEYGITNDDDVKFIMMLVKKLKNRSNNICDDKYNSSWTDGRYMIGTGRSSMLMDPMKDWKALIKPINNYCLPNESWNNINIYFDHIAYANLNPDVKKAYGYNKEKLYHHYIRKQKEGQYSILKDSSGKNGVCYNGFQGPTQREYVSDVNVAKQKCTALPFCRGFNATKTMGGKLEIDYKIGQLGNKIQVNPSDAASKDGRGKCYRNEAKYELVKDLRSAKDGLCAPIGINELSKESVSNINVAKQKCDTLPDCMGFSATPESSNKLNIVYKTGLLKEENQPRVGSFTVAKSKCYRNIKRDRNEKKKGIKYNLLIDKEKDKIDARLNWRGVSNVCTIKGYDSEKHLFRKKDKLGVRDKFTYYTGGSPKNYGLSNGNYAAVIDKAKQKCKEMPFCTGFSTWVRDAGCKEEAGKALNTMFGWMGSAGENLAKWAAGEVTGKQLPKKCYKTLNVDYFNNQLEATSSLLGPAGMRRSCYKKIKPGLEEEAKAWEEGWKKL